MPETDHKFDARLDLVPESPGVYLMKDASGSVIYVGKAVSLRSRLRSYFTHNPKGMPKVLAMISNIADFEYLVCSNETEALLLECNLIKQNRPKYNILLMDDKEYPYIRITYNEQYPKVVKAYRIGPDIAEGAKYYGPYLNGTLRKALDVLKEFFPVRNCNLDLPKEIGRRRPCLNHHIGKCPAPCGGFISRDDYMVNIEGIRRFLEGKYGELLKATEKSMNDAAEELKFENAAVYRDRLVSLRQMIEKQTVALPTGKDVDIIGFAAGDAESCVMKLEVREGRLVGSAAFFVTGELNDPDDDLLEVLIQHYTNTAYIPKEVLLPGVMGSSDLLSEVLTNLRGAKTVVRVPVRGKGRDLSEMADRNALAALRRRNLMAVGGSYAAKATLEKLSEIIFGVPDLIRRIEAFDISNYGNEDISASMVVFEDGKPYRAGYRLFKIGEQGQQDDYAAMRQAVRRRLARVKDEEFGNIPQLILVDGGAAHASVVMEEVEKAGIENIAVLGMVKDSKHRTRGLADASGKELRLTVSENNDDGLESDDRRNLLRLISGIQDEAHRFAGNYTRKLSRKRQLKFSLESIPGVGETRRKILMRKFGSIRAVKSASVEELETTDGIDRKTAQEIYKYFHSCDPVDDGERQ
ncbi:MAG: excinuclease ABC subunit UvrC [Eubacteriales bacterium]|nr:excinuclease ABC subunit UvrC [Eubacteriales bacterium]MDD4327475.1 excinuclease ABC subunit UvrC [Eubacteriales bacterium]MDD4716776.1 excinuclease ABC subunit UvrC [Eubacteriales bacterium]